MELVQEGVGECCKAKRAFGRSSTREDLGRCGGGGVYIRIRSEGWQWGRGDSTTSLLILSSKNEIHEQLESI
jgi:hypothetical protein